MIDNLPRFRIKHYPQSVDPDGRYCVEFEMDPDTPYTDTYRFGFSSTREGAKRALKKVISEWTGEYVE
jgi:hypothetical protein